MKLKCIYFSKIFKLIFLENVQKFQGISNLQFLETVHLPRLLIHTFLYSYHYKIHTENMEVCNHKIDLIKINKNLRKE